MPRRPLAVAAALAAVTLALTGCAARAVTTVSAQEPADSPSWSITSARIGSAVAAVEQSFPGTWTVARPLSAPAACAAGSAGAVAGGGAAGGGTAGRAAVYAATSSWTGGSAEQPRTTESARIAAPLATAGWSVAGVPASARFPLGSVEARWGSGPSPLVAAGFDGRHWVLTASVACSPAS